MHFILFSYVGAEFWLLCGSVADFSSNVKGKLYIIENIHWRTVEIYLIANVCTENHNKVFSETITIYQSKLRNNYWLLLVLPPPLEADPRSSKCRGTFSIVITILKL